MRRKLVFTSAVLPMLLSTAAFAATAGMSVVDGTGALVGTYAGTAIVGSSSVPSTTFDTVITQAGSQWIRVMVGPGGFNNFSGGFTALFASDNCTGQAYVIGNKVVPLCTSSPVISKNKTAFLPKITVYCPAKTLQTVTINSAYLSEDPRGAQGCLRSPPSPTVVGALTSYVLNFKAPFTLK